MVRFIPITGAEAERGAIEKMSGEAIEQAFPRFADDLTWWVEAAKARRARKAPPY